MGCLLLRMRDMAARSLRHTDVRAPWPIFRCDPALGLADGGVEFAGAIDATQRMESVDAVPLAVAANNKRPALIFSNQGTEFGNGFAHGTRRALTVKGAEPANAEIASIIEPRRRRADVRAQVSRFPAFPNSPFPIDEEVITDIRGAQAPLGRSVPGENIADHVSGMFRGDSLGVMNCQELHGTKRFPNAPAAANRTISARSARPRAPRLKSPLTQSRR